MSDAARSWADATLGSFWLARGDAPPTHTPIAGVIDTDLAIVGGGFTGLWTAIHAKEEAPARDVVLIDSDTIGSGASGRNGGICGSSLTHGLQNGWDRFPAEFARNEALARENLASLHASTERYGIDCDWSDRGVVWVAQRPHEIEWAHSSLELMLRAGDDAVFLDLDAVQAEVRSASFLAGAWRKTSVPTLDPAKLVRGLARAATGLGVRIFEHTRALTVRADGEGVAIDVPSGSIRARRVVLGTNAFAPLVGKVRRYVVPVYDHVMVTEPLSAAQWDAIGWSNRQAVVGLGNQFNYSRVTADGRILWGGYDAIYHWNNGISPAFEDRPASYDQLARTFFATFPQLGGLRFTHRWAGVIDTCSRFSVFFDTALDGRAAYAVGFTGMGIAASRFAARTALDLVDHRDTERTRLELVRTRPTAFPPEPLRWLVIELTRRALARSDRRAGKRGMWLRLLDALGLGFHS
ncbi:MAG: FAD-dependent oxidoreductase [Kofleriaceae bacterium]